MELILVLLAAFVVYLIRLWLTNRGKPEPTYATPLMRKWNSKRHGDEKAAESRWEADFEALDRDRRLEAERVQQGRADRAREWAERAKLKAERRERVQRETSQLVADYERFRRENPEPPPYKAPVSSAEVFARLRGELDNL